MYFPYLRGRQFELIALRELAECSLMSSEIIPIIEPVKLSSTLTKTIQVFRDTNRALSLVRNPQVGSFTSDLKMEKNTHLKAEFYELIKFEKLIYTVYLNSSAEKTISKLVESGRDISGIITLCDNEDNISIYEAIFSSGKPKYNLIPDEGAFRRRIRHNRVMIGDKFKKQARNTDYAETGDEPFSSDHLYFSEDGYVGFSDYSIIGNEYIEAGFAPYAVAIHIVYFDEEKRLRIKHFVSDTNDDITDPAGKFSEAVGKLVEWNKTKKLDTVGINTFTQMYEDEVYPGLGTVKKLSLMHHIELMSRFLDGVLK